MAVSESVPACLPTCLSTYRKYLGGLAVSVVRNQSGLIDSDSRESACTQHAYGFDSEKKGADGGISQLTVHFTLSFTFAFRSRTYLTYLLTYFEFTSRQSNSSDTHKSTTRQSDSTVVLTQYIPIQLYNTCTSLAAALARNRRVRCEYL